MKCSHICEGYVTICENNDRYCVSIVAGYHLLISNSVLMLVTLKNLSITAEAS